MRKTILKHFAGIFMVCLSLMLSQEGRTRLEASAGNLIYNKFWLARSIKSAVRTAAADEVESIERGYSRCGTHNIPVRNVLIIKLKDGSVFYRESCSGIFTPFGDFDFCHVEEIDKALRTKSFFAIEHSNSVFMLAGCLCVLVSVWCWLAMFGKSRQVNDFFKKLWDRYPDCRPKKPRWDEW